MIKIEKWIEERFPNRQVGYIAQINKAKQEAAKETAKYILEECGVLEALEEGAQLAYHYNEEASFVKIKEALNKIKGEKDGF